VPPDLWLALTVTLHRFWDRRSEKSLDYIRAPRGVLQRFLSFVVQVREGRWPSTAWHGPGL
jgi:hypothetical protein